MNVDYYEDADIQQFKTMQDLIEPAYPLDIRIFDIWRFRPHVNAFKKAINNPDACDLIKFKEQLPLARSIVDKYAGKTLNVAIIYYEVALFAFNRAPHKKVIVPDLLFTKPKPINAQLLYTDLSDDNIIIEREALPLADKPLAPGLNPRVDRHSLNKPQKSMDALQQWEQGARQYITGEQLRACQGQPAQTQPSLYKELENEKQSNLYEDLEDDKLVPGSKVRSPEIKEKQLSLDIKLGSLFSQAPKKPKFDAKQFADKPGKNGLTDTLKNLFRKK
jgi:hypothetical protein